MSNISDNNAFEEIYTYSPWIEASNMDWDCLISNLSPKKYCKNEVIFYQHSICDYVYLVKEGRVRLSIYSPNGEEKSIFIADKGTFIGELSTIDGLANICRATAAIDSMIFLIPKSQFIKELNTNNIFAVNLLNLFTKKIRVLTEQIKQLSFNRSYYRVCIALVHLIKQYGTQGEEGYKLHMKFTHQEMADLTGLSRVSVSNIISDLSAREILRKENGYIIVKDINSILGYLDDNK